MLIPLMSASCVGQAPLRFTKRKQQLCSNVNPSAMDRPKNAAPSKQILFQCCGLSDLQHRYHQPEGLGLKLHSMPGMTGRPGYRTMEMIGGSSAPYLARTPCVPLFCTSFNRVGNKERFRLPGAGGGSFPLYGGTFARSYSVSIHVRSV